MHKAATALAFSDAETKARLIRDMLKSGRPVEASEVLNSELIRRLTEQRVTLRAQFALHELPKVFLALSVFRLAGQIDHAVWILFEVVEFFRLVRATAPEWPLATDVGSAPSSRTTM